MTRAELIEAGRQWTVIGRFASGKPEESDFIATVSGLANELEAAEKEAALDHETIVELLVENEKLKKTLDSVVMGKGIALA